MKEDICRSDAHLPGLWTVRLACVRLRVRSLGPATFFCGDWSWNHFYGHSLPTTESSRAVVSYWRKDVHLVLVNRLESLPRNSVDRSTVRRDMTIVVDWDVKPQIKQRHLYVTVLLFGFQHEGTSSSMPWPWIYFLLVLQTKICLLMFQVLILHGCLLMSLLHVFQTISI